MTHIIGKLQNDILMFMFFSIAVTGVFYLIKPRYRLYYLAAVSIVFYTLCTPLMTLLLLAVALLVFVCSENKDPAKAKRWLKLGIIPGAVILALFKYFNFFVDEITGLLTNLGINFSDMKIARIAVPLGLSYYIFRGISLVADCYRKKSAVEFTVRSFFEVFTYLAFFPHIICGPIQRFDEFKASIDRDFVFNKELFNGGVQKILTGMFMKLVIANRLSPYTSYVFGNPEANTGLALLGAALFYTVQIYCDFAGYSDISIGISNLLGIECSENFNKPYFSVNIKEFWNRWHISLSLWLRDYIYIPLGGNRCSGIRRKINVLIVFLVSGLWHGAGFTFIVWGLYHGILNIITPKKSGSATGIKRICLIVLTDIAVAFGWIFFASPDIRSAFIFIKRLFTTFGFDITDIQNAVLPFTQDNTCVAAFIVALVFIVFLIFREISDETKLKDKNTLKVLCNSFMLSSLLLFGVFTASSFIYANF